MSHIFGTNAAGRLLIAQICALVVMISSSTSAYSQDVTPIPVAPSAPSAPPSTGEPSASPVASADRTVLSTTIRETLPNRTTAKRFGEGLAATFAEADGPVIYSVKGDAPLMPASTIKLFTAAFALRALGPDTRLATTVRLVSRDTTDPSNATIALVGGGDPLLSSANLRQLAKSTHTSLASLGVSKVSVIIDDQLFPEPSPASGWRGSYGLSTIAPVRALNRDRRNLSDSSKDAAQFFVKRLREAGTPARLMGRGERVDPNTAPELASYRGHTVSHAVRLMSVLSDNDIAENLFRHIAIARGYPPTWQGASNAFAAEANSLGISATNLKFVDGSGLSRDNRLTPNALVQLLQISLSGKEPALVGLTNDTYLASAGKSGTLRSRYESDKIKCSKGEIYAKTGSLRDVSSLAGVANGVDGHRRVFAVLVNGPRVKSAPRSISNGIDSLATTLVGCR